MCISWSMAASPSRVLAVTREGEHQPTDQQGYADKESKGLSTVNYPLPSGVLSNHAKDHRNQEGVEYHGGKVGYHHCPSKLTQACNTRQRAVTILQRLTTGAVR